MYVKVDLDNLIVMISPDEREKYARVDWEPTESIMDERGVYRYKLVDGKPVERTQEEMDAD